MPEPGAERPPREQLADDLRAWRIDRVLGPVVLFAGVVAVVLAALGLESSLLLAPAVVALVRGVPAVVRLWRRRAWRYTGFDRLGTTVVTRIRADITTGGVRDGERDLAARLLVNEGAILQVAGWNMLLIGAGPTVRAGSADGPGSPGLVIGAFGLALSVAAFAFLYRQVAQAERLLDVP